MVQYYRTTSTSSTELKSSYPLKAGNGAYNLYVLFTLACLIMTTCQAGPNMPWQTNISTKVQLTFRVTRGGMEIVNPQFAAFHSKN